MDYTDLVTNNSNLPVVGGAVTKDLVVPSFSPDSSLTSGEVNCRILSPMTAYHRLANLLEVDGKISCKIRVPMIFNICQVDMEKVKQQNIDYEVSDNHVILNLKAQTDTGSSHTLLGENLVGQVIRDKGECISQFYIG